jgi:hypothetical protein
VLLLLLQAAVKALVESKSTEQQTYGSEVKGNNRHEQQA